MNSTERKNLHKLIKQTRDKRNAAKDNQEFDYLHKVYEHYLSLLKTEKKKQS